MSEVKYLKCDCCEHEFAETGSEMMFQGALYFSPATDNKDLAGGMPWRRYWHLCKQCHAELMRVIEATQRSLRDSRNTRAA